MLRQVILGAIVSLANIAIHALVVAWIILAVRRAAAGNFVPRPLLRLIVMTGGAAVALMLAHVVEVSVWAGTYAFFGIAPEADPAYFAFVNYTTLGYGDVVPVAEWRLIGPITAMNGVLLFGLSTAVLFEVIRTVGNQLQRPALQTD